MAASPAAVAGAHRKNRQDPRVQRAYSEPMKIHWGRAFGGAVIAEIGLVAASIVWVAVYGYLINPGQPPATYQAYAQASGTWVSLFAGLPIFYAAGRWIARSQRTALALFGIFAAVDGALLVSMTESWTGFPFVLVGLSYLTKIPPCALGGRHG
jgi:hypothetical protein